MSNILTRMINTVMPNRGATHKRHSSVPKIRRGRNRALRVFKAAKSDGIAKFDSFNWVPHREVNRAAIMGLVSHSRQQAQNNPFMRHFLKTMQRNIVGRVGLRMESKAVNVRGVADTADRKAIEKAWQNWSKRGNCTVCGLMSFKAVQDRAVKFAARDGACFIREYRGPDFGPFGFQIQLMTIEALDLDHNVELDGGSYIHGGIEYNQFDKPLAYWFFKKGAVRPHTNQYSNERTRVDAARIHVITQNDDDVAGLGVPWAHATLRDMNQEESFGESALVAARAGASTMGFLEQNGSVADQIFEAEGDARKSIDDEDGDVEREIPDINELEPGSMTALPLGWSFKGFSPGYPDAAVGPFFKVMNRRSAAGLGLSYATYTGDLSDVNFASMRRGVQEERDEFSIHQTWLIEVFCEPIFQNWVSMFLISDWNEAYTNLPYKPEKYQAVEWHARGFESVQPLDDAQANNMNVSAGYNSPQRICAARGLNFETVVLETADALKFAEKHKVPLSFVASTMAKPETANNSNSKQEPNEGGKNAKQK